jgi:hypothetical protein
LDASGAIIIGFPPYSSQYFLDWSWPAVNKSGIAWNIESYAILRISWDPCCKSRKQPLSPQFAWTPIFHFWLRNCVKQIREHCELEWHRSWAVPKCICSRFGHSKFYTPKSLLQSRERPAEAQYCVAISSIIKTKESETILASLYWNLPNLGFRIELTARVKNIRRKKSLRIYLYRATSRYGTYNIFHTSEDIPETHSRKRLLVALQYCNGIGERQTLSKSRTPFILETWTWLWHSLLQSIQLNRDSDTRVTYDIYKTTFSINQMSTMMSMMMFCVFPDIYIIIFWVSTADRNSSTYIYRAQTHYIQSKWWPT